MDVLCGGATAPAPPQLMGSRTRDQVLLGLANSWRAALGQRRSSSTTPTATATSAVVGTSFVQKGKHPHALSSFLTKNHGSRLLLSTRSTSSLSTSSTSSTTSSPSSSSFSSPESSPKSSASSVTSSLTIDSPCSRASPLASSRWQPRLWTTAVKATTPARGPFSAYLEPGSGPAADFLLAIQQQIHSSPLSMGEVPSTTTTAPPQAINSGNYTHRSAASGVQQHTQTSPARLWGVVGSLNKSRRNIIGNNNNVVPTNLQKQGGSVSSEAAHHLVHSLQEYQYECLKHSVLARITQDQYQDVADDEATSLAPSITCFHSSQYTAHDLVQDRTSSASSAFYITDHSKIIRQYCAWRYSLPSIAANFNVGGQPNLQILKTVSALGIRLCCSSRADVLAAQALVEHSGFRPQLMDNKPSKTPSHLSAILQAGITTLTVDSAEEVQRIVVKAHALGIDPASLSLMIRLRAPLYKGFVLGAMPDMLPTILMTAAEVGMSVIGLSLDMRQFICYDTWPEGQITAALGHTKAMVDECSVASSNKLQHVHLLGLDKMFMGSMLQATIDQFFPAGTTGMTFSIDATTHLMDGSATLATRVIGKSQADATEGGVSRGFRYYLDDGCYGSLGDIFLHKKKMMPYPLKANGNPLGSDYYPSTLYGPTCDSLDCITKMTTLPELEIDDWIYFRNVGNLPSFSARTNFNGLKGPDAVHCFTGIRGGVSKAGEGPAPQGW